MSSVRLMSTSGIPRNYLVYTIICFANIYFCLFFGVRRLGFFLFELYSLFIVVCFVSLLGLVLIRSDGKILGCVLPKNGFFPIWGMNDRELSALTLMVRYDSPFFSI